LKFKKIKNSIYGPKENKIEYINIETTNFKV